MFNTQFTICKEPVKNPCYLAQKSRLYPTSAPPPFNVEQPLLAHFKPDLVCFLKSLKS